jgi:hypothetical protein
VNLSRPARQLYDLAYELANQRRDQAVDGLHVMLAVLQHPHLAGRAGEALAELEPRQKMLWTIFIQYELDVHRPEAASADFKSSRLLSYERVWTNATSQWSQVTSAQIVETLLRNDQALVQMMRYCGIEPSAVLRALADHAALGEEVGTGGPVPGSLMPGSYAAPIVPPRVSLDSLPSVPAVMPPVMPSVTGPRFPIVEAPPLESARILNGGRSLLQRFARPVAASPTSLYAHLHPPISTRLVDQLSEGQRGHSITVFAGKCGSPAQTVAQVMADRLAYVDRSNPLGAIRGLAGVVVVFAGELLDETQREVPTEQEIQGLFQDARDRRLILVMEDAELLAKDVGEISVREHILRELGRPSEVPVFAVYHLGEDERYEPGRVSLGLRTAEPIHLQPDAEERTRTLLKTAFRPYWQQLGYTFADPDRAFDLLFKLAPGIWATRHTAGKRWDEQKVLPYAVIDVAIETIEMLTKNQDVLYVAQTALGTLEPMRAREREIEKPDIREALKKSDEDIRKLASRTKPEFRMQMPMEITRAHLMAQLFYPNGTQFRPFAPRAEEVIPAFPAASERERY